MVYRSYRRRQAYRRPVARRKRESLTAKHWGSFGLTDDNQVNNPIDLFQGYQNDAIAAREAERVTITSVMGWITYYVPGGATPDLGTSRIWFGTRVESSSLYTGLDLAGRQKSAPYTGSSGLNDRQNYMDWQWLVSRPVPTADDSDGSHDTQQWQAWAHRIPVRIRQMRKLRSIDDSLYLLAGVNFAPGSGGDITCVYDLTVHALRP